MDNYEDITWQNDLGCKRVSIRVDSEHYDCVTLETGVWNYGAIVNALVRYKYSADKVEAIVNNSLMLMQNPSAVSEDKANEQMSELDELQNWREKCKARAKELLAIGEELGLEIM
jgi:hypothetical protein